jgi:trehalose synthase
MPMIHLAPRRLADYDGSVDPAVLAALQRRAEPLAGLRVLHLSAGPFGSTVADMLTGLVPLQRDLGIAADWHLLRGDAPRLWLALYEALAGGTVHWGEKERQSWLTYAERHAGVLDGDYDLVIAHDPQAVVLAEVITDTRPARWVWHCHLDTRDAQPEVWADVRACLQSYAAVLYPAPELRRHDLELPYEGLGRPAIDPLAPRNRPLAAEAVTAALGQLGVDPGRPFIAQVAPIDHRYAPIAALGTYWLARREVPGLQIVLVESSAASTERARRDLDQVADAAGGDSDVHLLTGQAGLAPADLNAIGRGCAIALQMAVPRGFGWGLAECQWKNRPAVVGQHGQLPEQVGHDEAGFLVEGAPKAAEAVTRLLREPARAVEMGERGHDRIARDYLITGLLSDYLDLFERILSR